ncbi:TDT family transporter [Streptomyces sp. NPDC003077]|uniref:TDT family transporter n=1 Tax=Streptomyces sp. NPDC003077 TaxID=3154443 RepID=UPI0033A5237F
MAPQARLRPPSGTGSHPDTGRTGPRTVPSPRTASSPSVRHLGPNWYATVMGTAIVATAGTAVFPSGPHLVYQVVWALSVAMLAALVTARAVHWLRHADQARRHLLDPAVAPFHGCTAMAPLAVAGATTAVGPGVIGERAAVLVHGVLWVAGTALGLVAAAGIPYLMATRHRIAADGASPVWLLPVVAPMVSAATGPALVPHLPAGQARATLLLACCALFGMSLFATLLILPLVFSRLLRHGPPALPLTPTLFLVLGPLGQSTTAVHNVAEAAPGVLGHPYADAFRAFAVVYGVPVTGFALLWLAVAVAMTVRAVRAGLPFAMTWWGATFPVGTCVTGAAGLARQTGLTAFLWLAAGLYALLVAAWLTAGTRTALGLWRGDLLAPPAAKATPVGTADVASAKTTDVASVETAGATSVRTPVAGPTKTPDAASVWTTPAPPGPSPYARTEAPVTPQPSTRP